MEITDIKFRKFFKTEPLKAICSVTVDDSLAIHDLKLVRASEKTILVMPSRKRADGNYTDIVHPINSSTRKMFETQIINAYEEQLKNLSDEDFIN
ncbi:MAG: septation protein SpoVG [Ruminococcaceae bacterium]|nr:septation protein SpoVG [Oscillospiraceae bacterium]